MVHANPSGRATIAVWEMHRVFRPHNPAAEIRRRCVVVVPADLLTDLRSFATGRMSDRVGTFYAQLFSTGVACVDGAELAREEEVESAAE